MHNRVIQELEHKILLQDFKLNSLLEITNAINTNQPVEQLTRILGFILKEQLGFDKFILFTKQDNWRSLLKTGIKGKIKNIDVEKDLFRFKEITVIESSPSKILDEFDVVVPIFHKSQPLAYLLIAGLEHEKLRLKETLSNISFIQTLVNVIVVAVENKRMTKLGIIQERIKKELELASEMQKLFFPDDLPSNKRMDVSAKYTPRHEVGGDYYDFIPLGNEEYIICIGDVSGKGIGAAMLMANFQATIRTLFSYQRFELDFLIEELNQKVMKSAKGEKFITFFIAHYNADTRKLKYINAGHNHPFVTTGKKVEMLDQGTIGLGMLDELPFINQGSLELKPNTTLVLYTDGVIELENAKNEFFELERLIKLVHNYYPLSMEDLNNLIFSKLDEWRADKNLVDDTAIFTCRFF
ncbi:MAG: PP2C family protein-serine/threonine phosphatase [Crocinitomicaceae bacterium]|nr:PP2C family protein-serine/threonine phosphatase [Crocinitomicaceae bacterium]